MKRLFFVLLLILCSVNAPAQELPRILAGTGTSADILRDLCGKQAHIRQLIPGGTCPGHYDLRPGDLEFLGEADLLVLEPYQLQMANMHDLIGAAENSYLQILTLPPAKSAMLPQTQLEYTHVLADYVKSHFQNLASHVAEAAKRRIERIKSVARQVRAQFDRAQVTDVSVLCSGMQAAFVGWAGLKVAACYGRPEDLSPATIRRLLEIGRKHRVKLVLDNVQSGPGTGKSIAETLQAGHADLTSFPGGVPGEERWESAFRGNVLRMLHALERSRS